MLRLNKTRPDQKSAFEWTPPNVTEDLAADYMKALPEEKLPIAGSAGAAFRKQQLQKQLPLHDIDHKVCDQLSEQERKEFEKYLQNLKKYVGQGQVTKVQMVYNFVPAGIIHWIATIGFHNSKLGFCIFR